MFTHGFLSFFTLSGTAFIYNVNSHRVRYAIAYVTIHTDGVHRQEGNMFGNEEWILI